MLSAVFVPCAFISGITGEFFRQFALTIAVSTVISAFNSLTLSPALASRLLRAHGAPRDVVQRTIDLRNPYVDPMNAIQVELLRRHRAGDESARLPLLRSIAGISAALR